MLRFLALAAVTAALVGCDRSSSIDQELVTNASFNLGNSPTVAFNVPDMMCAEGCGADVKEILSKQPGAKDVLVDFDSKTATVAIEEGAFDSDKALAALVDKQYLKSSLKDDSAAKPQAAEAVQ